MKLKISIYLFFSLDKQKKYNIKQAKKTIGFELNFCWGFDYSYNEIVFSEKPTEKMINWFEMILMISISYELNERERNFSVKSFEIFLYWIL